MWHTYTHEQLIYQHNQLSRFIVNGDEFFNMTCSAVQENLYCFLNII